jgi:hypothetical protein
MAQQFLSGLVLGAGLVWFLDPRRGGRRRAIVRDKMKHLAHELEQAARVGGHDLAHRAEGLKAEVEALRRPAPTDVKLEARVRSELGHLCSHTGGIRVHAEGHHVRLEGPVRAAEVDEIVRHVARLRGIDEVESHLEPKADSCGVPALQGVHLHRRRVLRVMPPAAHLVLGTSSGLLGLGALARGSLLGFAIGAVGAMANAHAIVTRNRPVRRERGPRAAEPKPATRTDGGKVAGPTGSPA